MSTFKFSVTELGPCEFFQYNLTSVLYIVCTVFSDDLTRRECSPLLEVMRANWLWMWLLNFPLSGFDVILTLIFAFEYNMFSDLFTQLRVNFALSYSSWKTLNINLRGKMVAAIDLCIFWQWLLCIRIWKAKVYRKKHAFGIFESRRFVSLKNEKKTCIRCKNQNEQS